MNTVVVNPGLFATWDSLFRFATGLFILIIMVAIAIVLIGLAVREYRRMMFKNSIWMQVSAENTAFDVELQRAQRVQNLQRQGVIAGPGAGQVAPDGRMMEQERQAA
jgi:hypothetical protein